jgi:hypothetical protein
MGLRTFRALTLAMMAALLVLMPIPLHASNGDEDGNNPPEHKQDDARHGWARDSVQRRTPAPIGDQGEIGDHLDQNRINSGEARFQEIFSQGAKLFQARFNKLDGQGRPTFTNQGPRPAVNENFIRTGGPDSGSCWSCHNIPRSGGGGDFNSLMFTGLHFRNPPEMNTLTSLTNHRTGPSVFGDGLKEMLAREISDELRAIRAAAKAEALSSGQSVTKPLVSKGVSYGSITAQADGKIDPTGIQGIDWDLVVKPFTFKGNGTSLRGFPIGGSLLHHGMQAFERFGDVDADNDGVPATPGTGTNELSIGDVTAMTVWMAAIPPPGRVMPKDKGRRAAVLRGEQVFSEIDCATCHTPVMYLDGKDFSEPSPFNTGTTILTVGALASQGAQPFRFDLTRQGPGPRPETTRDGRVIVRLFSDLKRHNITDPSGKLSDEFAGGFGLVAGSPGVLEPSSAGVAALNTGIVHTVPNSAAPLLSSNVFITQPLWGVGSTSPYGHRGDLSTLTEAILVHGNEAAGSRAKWTGLSQSDKDCLIEFLRSLQVVPVDAPLVTDEGDNVR